MELLQEIQNTAVKADADVAALLRLCKILAARLGSSEFSQWVESELNGYPSADLLPSYRVLNVESYGNFVGPFQTMIKNVPLPPSLLPDPQRYIANKAYLAESVSAYASLIKEASPTFKIAWSADAVLAFGQAFIENNTCVEAWRLLSRGALAAVIETVKNRVLSFALELESHDPRAGDVASNETSVEVGQLFNRQIRRTNKVFIGHGRSHEWKDLRRFLVDRLRLDCVDFNSEPVAGYSTKDRLQEILESAVFAFLVMTGEDEQSDGTMRARENVVHEVGLFQGRLGFAKAIILLEEGCSRFSNIDGLTYIAFPKSNIEGASEDIRRVLEREGLLQP